MTRKFPEQSPVDQERRTFFNKATVGGVALTGLGALGLMQSSPAHASGISDWINVKTDFNAVGNGVTDDTNAFINAIAAGSANQKPIFVPPGGYIISQPLTIPSNTMIVGSNEGLGFGCVLKPVNCAAFNIGIGSAWSFHSSIRNLMIWPQGAASSHVISINKCYSVVLGNIRIHTSDSSWIPTIATILLKGDPSLGGTGNGASNNIIWENLIVRSDSGQPTTCILAEAGCGSHRFIHPDLENYGTLLNWQGGEIDFVLPYTERAGYRAVDTTSLSTTDTSAYFKTYGGKIVSAHSGVACALGANTRNFNSFGTEWKNPDNTKFAVYAYGIPARPQVFHGVTPDFGATGNSRFGGVANWQRGVAFPDYLLKTSDTWAVTVPSKGQAEKTVSVNGVGPGAHWARVNFSSNLNGLQLSAYVSSSDTVTVVAQNNKSSSETINGTLFIEAGLI
jgi:Pectate lyase superfamily protein